MEICGKMYADMRGGIRCMGPEVVQVGCDVRVQLSSLYVLVQISAGL